MMLSCAGGATSRTCRNGRNTLIELGRSDLDVGDFMAGLKWSDIGDVDLRQHLQTGMLHDPKQRDGWSSASRL